MFFMDDGVHGHICFPFFFNVSFFILITMSGILVDSWLLVTYCDLYKTKFWNKIFDKVLILHSVSKNAYLAHAESVAPDLPAHLCSLIWELHWQLICQIACQWTV